MSRLDMTPAQAACYGAILEAKGPIAFLDVVEKIGKSPASISRYMKKLAAMKLIVVTSRPSETGSGRRCYACAREHVETTLAREPDPDWPSKVSPLQREVYAAILDLAPDATYAALTERLQTQRGTVNVACQKLADLGAVVLDTRYGHKRRHMVAFPNRGAETYFRDFRASRVRPDWTTGLPISAIEAYKILRHRGPSFRGEIMRHPAWAWTRSTLSKSLLELHDVEAVVWEEQIDETGHPARLYRAVRGDIGRPTAAKPKGTKEEPQDNSAKPWASKPYRPPSKGRVRYRKLGRGHE